MNPPKIVKHRDGWKLEAVQPLYIDCFAPDGGTFLTHWHPGAPCPQSAQPLYCRACEGEAAGVPHTPVNDGWHLTVGGCYWEAVDLAGHTPGQLGLWDPVHGLFFAGDLVRADGFPPVIPWDDAHDALEIALRNLKKARTMRLKLLYPAHGGALPDPTARIDETLAHHRANLDAICARLEPGDGAAEAFADLTDPDTLRAYLIHLCRIDKLSQSNGRYHLNR